MFSKSPAVVFFFVIFLSDFSFRFHWNFISVNDFKKKYKFYHSSFVYQIYHNFFFCASYFIHFWKIDISCKIRTDFLRVSMKIVFFGTTLWTYDKQKNKLFNFVPIRYIYIVVNRRDNSSSNSGKISAIMCHKYQNSQRKMIIFIFYSFYIDPLWQNIWRYGRLSLHYMSRSDTWAEVQQFNLWSVAFTNAVLVSRCLALCNELILNILIYPLYSVMQFTIRTSRLK